MFCRSRIVRSFSDEAAAQNLYIIIYLYLHYLFFIFLSNGNGGIRLQTLSYMNMIFFFISESNNQLIIHGNKSFGRNQH